MKPGMQRDILVAYWLLFDEFDIGDNDLQPAAGANSDAQPTSPTTPQRPKPPDRD